MEIVDLKIADLRPAEYNPRQITKKQFEDLRRSIQEFGEMEPAIVNTYKGRENVIISGHQRIKVAVDLGLEKWPCVLVKLPPKKEKELNIRMNKNTGEWDMDGLANNFDVEELIEWGFDSKDFPSFDDITESTDSKTDSDMIIFTITVPFDKAADFKNLMIHNKGLYEKISSNRDGNILQS